MQIICYLFSYREGPVRPLPRKNGDNPQTNTDTNIKFKEFSEHLMEYWGIEGSFAISQD